MTGGPTPLADLNSAVKKVGVKKGDDTLSCNQTHNSNQLFKFKEYPEVHSVSKYDAKSKEFWNESIRKVSYPTDASKIAGDKQNLLKPALRVPSNNSLFQAMPSEFSMNKKVAFSSYRNIRLFKSEQGEDEDATK